MEEDYLLKFTVYVTVSARSKEEAKTIGDTLTAETLESVIPHDVNAEVYYEVI